MARSTRGKMGSVEKFRGSFRVIRATEFLKSGSKFLESGHLFVTLVVVETYLYVLDDGLGGEGGSCNTIDLQGFGILDL